MPQPIDRRRFFGLAGAAGAGLVVGRPTAGVGAQSTAVAHRYEYVFTNGTATVYDMDNGQTRVRTLSLGSDVIDIRGACFSPATGQLYVSYLGADQTHGFLIRYDLAARKRVWRRSYATGLVDSMDILPNGQRIYMPTGAQTDTKVWRVLQASTGTAIVNVPVGLRPHDTVVSLDGTE